MNTDPSSAGRPLILPFAGVRPRLASPPRACAGEVSILGRVEIGAGSSFGFGAVVRADGHFVRIGDDVHLGEMATIHIAHDRYPTIIGSRVAAGRDAVLHACTIGDDCVVEDEVVILDGSVIENEVVIEAGATVFPGSRLEAGHLYAGSPAKPVRRLEAGELDRRRQAVAGAASRSAADAAGVARAFAEDVFLAANTTVSGRIRAAARSSIFFGCRLDAGTSEIVLGENTNIQDNTIIDAGDGAVVFGADTTVGHNVHLRSCRVGDRSLVGIGSDIAPGTVIDDDVMLAGGSVTLPEQRLESGWLWGGRPARPLRRLDDAKRHMIATTVTHYIDYAKAYHLAQAEAPNA